MCGTLGLNSDVVPYDETQDQVNKRSDFITLRCHIHDLITNISVTDAVGVQQQIETKLAEITNFLPPEERRRSPSRRPSSDTLPVIQMKKRVEELLGQFRAINIEVDDLQIHEQIGSGGFGTVSKATRLSTSELLAVKELRGDRLTMASWASLYAEVETMASVKHPFVLELVGAHITEPYRIITRFCSGKSLFDRLHRPRGLPLLNATHLTRLAFQVAVGMAHLHSLGIVHRDLKTLNILLGEDGTGCVADFGLSGMMRNNQELCGGVGTPHYTTPEVLAHTRYGPKVDTYSYGVVLWEMLMRKVPYGDMPQMAIYEHVVTRGWRLPIPNDTPQAMKKLITRCWAKNPTDRPEFVEIVSWFETGEIFFAGSDRLDFQAIRNTKPSPALDIPFAIRVLKDPGDPHFSSVVYYLCAQISDELRHRLREEEVISGLVSSQTKSIDAILLLASVLLALEEFTGFISNGGLEMFRSCVESQRGQAMSSALRFGLAVPRSELAQLKPFLPRIVHFRVGGGGIIPAPLLQFLTRFEWEELEPFKAEISDAVIVASSKVGDQATFDSIAHLLPLCRDCLSTMHFRQFYSLLSSDFVVPPAFVSTLIEANDSWTGAALIFSILKASTKSDLNAVFLPFLQNCAQNDKDVFVQLYKMESFFTTIQELLESGSVRTPLFILYCIAPITDAALKLACHPVLTTLVQMRGWCVQRLQIFTILCVSEFCSHPSVSFDGIIRLLVESLSSKSLVEYAVRLISAFSRHAAGCQILSDHGVLELFTQSFLSSSTGEDTAVTHALLRNFARQGCEIPQGSLIISCLMQDMLYDVPRRAEILDTLVALVKAMPNSVQEYDLQRIVMPQLNSDQPMLITLSLKLFAVCNPSLLRSLYGRLLLAIHKLLANPHYAYPEIINACLDVTVVIAEQFDVGEFVKKSEIGRFIVEVMELLPEGDPHIPVFKRAADKLVSLSTPSPKHY
jgi:serine/threonine protein kinase